MKRPTANTVRLLLILTWVGCSANGAQVLTPGSPKPTGVTSAWVSLPYPPAIDVLFVIDNSSTMAPKQAKLKEGFRQIIRNFASPRSGILPDLRVAMVTTDLGSGGAYQDGPCAAKILPDGTRSLFGDLGRFQMLGASACGVTDPAALWVEHQAGLPLNYQGELPDVFACLAGNLGTQGCFEKHPLQALEFALTDRGWRDTHEAQRTFLRKDAFLNIFIVTDEDDCSAGANVALFGDKPELAGETRNLRCATRSHACGGTNLSTTGPGYPTTQAFSAPLSTCIARTDHCSNSTNGPQATDPSGPTRCNPLEDVHTLVGKIKALKEFPSASILVAGTFGWPLRGADGWASLSEQYKIDLVPNPDPTDATHPRIYGAWPLCYDRAHPPSAPDVYDPEAAGWGATAGLRIAAFIDEFGDNGIKSSICEQDLTRAISSFSDCFDCRTPSLCIAEKLFDSDATVDGVQPDCRVVFRRPEWDTKQPARVVYREDVSSMPRCDSRLSDNAQAVLPCWKIEQNFHQCWANPQLVKVVRAPFERPQLPPRGTQLVAICRTCIADVPGVDAVPGCDYAIEY